MSVRLSPAAARPFAAVALAVASLVATTAVGSIFLSTARGARAAIAAAGPANPADGILIVVALVGVLLSLWVGLGMVLSALSALPGALGQACTLLSARIAPAAVRKVVAFVLGTALTAALVPGTAVARTAHEAPRPAEVASAQYAAGAFGNTADAAPDASFRFVSEPIHSTSEPIHSTSEPIHSTSEPIHSASEPIHSASEPIGTSDDEDVAPGPSWSPERRASPVNSAGRVADIVVRRGDSLWSIAARHLGPEATPAQINAEWHRWFAANQHMIGDDANLITPGQVLSPPASGQGDS
ncbi:MAG: LysM peptidoglycan-binding domain-containing protein [Dermatophilaceae bacterium]